MKEPKKLEDLLREWQKDLFGALDAIARDYDQRRKQEKFMSENKLRWN